MARGWKNFEAHDRKDLDCLHQTSGRNKDIESTLLRAQKEVKSTGEKAYVILENIYSIINRMLVEMCILNMPLVRGNRGHVIGN